MIYAPFFWIAAGLVWVLSTWTIIAVIMEVARAKSKPLSADVIVGVLFHGATAIAALKLANLAALAVQGV
ncbi:MAG: hypothetical protein GY847_15625 [Proteobacteria bacterium]|nr:hypothetical protein [Pseudomonadota bacterium]